MSGISPRWRLPNRRPNETVDLLFEGQRYHVTPGLAPEGRPAPLPAVRDSP